MPPNSSKVVASYKCTAPVFHEHAASLVPSWLAVSTEVPQELWKSSFLEMTICPEERSLVVRCCCTWSNPAATAIRSRVMLAQAGVSGACTAYCERHWVLRSAVQNSQVLLSTEAITISCLPSGVKLMGLLDDAGSAGQTSCKSRVATSNR